MTTSRERSDSARDFKPEFSFPVVSVTIPVAPFSSPGTGVLIWAYRMKSVLIPLDIYEENRQNALDFSRGMNALLKCIY
jgi:hypothetical protein